MRQGQQNRRNKNRPRRNQNTGSRNFDSNGPDVRVRGSASHVAEKYTSLARDANVAGNRVKAENLQQHAEHYNRIVMAAKAAREVVPAAVVKPIERQRHQKNNDRNKTNRNRPAGDVDNGEVKSSSAQPPANPVENSNGEPVAEKRKVRTRKPAPQPRKLAAEPSVAEIGAEPSVAENGAKQTATRKPVKAATPRARKIKEPETAKAKEKVASSEKKGSTDEVAI